MVNLHLHGDPIRSSYERTLPELSTLWTSTLVPFPSYLNMIGIAGTIAGFVVVFVAKDWRWVGPKAYQSSELNNQWGSVHAMLGLIACVVAWAQPLNAVFRKYKIIPREELFVLNFLGLLVGHPDGKGRWLFNIIHGFFGFGSWLCADSRFLQVFILLFFVVVAIGTAVAISVLIGLKPIA
ncbi:hypothetical protein COOONC_20059 [Cooperia oncophora]